MAFQARVRDVYLWQVKENSDFESIECIDQQGNMLSVEEISKKIIDKAESKLS